MGESEVVSGVEGDASGVEGDASGVEGDASGVEGDASGVSTLIRERSWPAPPIIPPIAPAPIVAVARARKFMKAFGTCSMTTLVMVS